MWQELQDAVDTLIVIPNQNLFRVANEKTTFADAFAMADQVLYSGVACITDLMVKEGLINLDFADVRSVMREMGKAMMGTGEASGDRRSTQAAEAAIANPLLDETSMKGAKGLLISITGGKDLTLFEVDEAATRIREEVDTDANIILGATFDESLEGVIRVSVVATGIDNEAQVAAIDDDRRTADISDRLRTAAIKQPEELPQTATALDTPRPAPIARKELPAAAQPAARAETPRPAQQPPAASIARRAPAAAAAKPTPAAAPIAAAASPAAASHGGASLAAATAAHEPDITIEPFQPGPLHHGPTELDAAPSPQAETEHPHARIEAPFVPPAAETPAPRIPRVQDFPPIARQQIAASRDGDIKPGGAEADRGPLSLLKRLATVGLGRRDERPLGGGQGSEQPLQQPRAPQAQAPGHQAPLAQPAAAGQQAAPGLQAPPRHAAPQAPPLAPQRPAQAAARAPAHHQPQGHPGQIQDAPYRPLQGDLDQHGRAAPRQNRPLDDELEIPAFLRRQAN